MDEKKTIKLGDYSNEIEEIIIPEGVEKIEVAAFRNFKKLKRVILPSTIKEISYGAFKGCISLENIKIPDGIISIGKEAFANCTSLKEISLPDVMVDISSGVFENCESLEKIILPAGIDLIWEDTFKGCKNLKEVSLPKSIRSIGSSAFENCESLEKIKIPENVNLIDFQVFYGCINLKEVEIPETTYELSICDDAFMWCKSLEKLSLPKHVSFGPKAFTGCENLKELDIPDYIDNLYMIILMVMAGQIKDGVKITLNFDKFSNLKFEINALKRSPNFEKIRFAQKTLNIDLYGDVLSNSKKRTIEDTLGVLFPNAKINIGYTDKNLIWNKKTRYKTWDEEINEMVEEIKDACNKMDNNSKKEFILNEVKNIVDNYKKRIQDLKPKISFEDKDPIDEIKEEIDERFKTVNGVQLDTFSKLNDLKEDICWEREHAKNIELIEKLINMVKIGSPYISLDKEAHPVLEKLNEILKNLDEITEEEKKEYLSQLETKLQEKKEIIANELNRNEIVHSPTYYLDYKREISDYISNIYMEVKRKANIEQLKEVKTFYNYLSKIDKTDVIPEISKSDDIGSLVENTRFLISRLDEKSKQELEKEFRRIINKHINRLSQIIENPYSKKRPEDIEFDLREDIQKILINISNKSCIDDYIKKKYSKKNITNQLETATELIKSKDLIDEEKYKKEIINMFVTDIINKIITNKEIIDPKIKEEIIIRTKKPIYNYLYNYLDKKETITKEEYDTIIDTIIKELGSILTKTDKYIHDVQELNNDIQKENEGKAK